MKNAALIGLGMVADTHLAALRDANSVSLRGVLGRNTAKAEDFAERARLTSGHEVHVYQTVEQISADPDVDFAILVTPPDARLGFVKALAVSGKPILMEKPIERTLTASVEIVERCEALNLPLGIVLQHRARAASAKLKEAISLGDLGQIVTAEIRVPWWRDQSYYDAPGRGTRTRDGGGVMITQAIHTLDLALWFLGPIQQVQALMSTSILHSMECEDWAGALFKTERGCIGTLMATTTSRPGASEAISLNGTKASAHLEAGVLTLTYQDGRVDTFGETAGTGGGADPMAFTHSWHQSVLENFVSHLDGKTELLASGRDALAAHAVIDAMERSNRSGSWTRVN